MHETRELTFLEAAAIVTGYGVGGGIMAVPYLASLSGIIPMFIMLILALSVSLLIHLMIAEIMLRDHESNQLVEVFARHLFKGRAGQQLSWLLFILVALAFLASLAAYIAGGGEIIMELSGIPKIGGQLLTYLIAAGVVLLGLKALGMSEKFAVGGIIILLIAFGLRASQQPFDIPAQAQSFQPNVLLALFGMLMFSFFAIFSVPQVVNGMQHNLDKVPGAIFIGIGTNAIIITSLVMLCLGTPGAVTKTAIVGLSDALGGWTATAGSIFILLAMLTSFWSVSFAMAVIVKERLGWGERPSWLIATLPALLVVLVNPATFLDYMRLAGGAIAVLIALLIVPLYIIVSKKTEAPKEWSLPLLQSRLVQAAVVIGYILMAVGSMVSIP